MRQFVVGSLKGERVLTSVYHFQHWWGLISVFVDLLLWISIKFLFKSGRVIICCASLFWITDVEEFLGFEKGLTKIYTNIAIGLSTLVSYFIKSLAIILYLLNLTKAVPWLFQQLFILSAAILFLYGNWRFVVLHSPIISCNLWGIICTTL